MNYKFKLLLSAYTTCKYTQTYILTQEYTHKFVLGKTDTLAATYHNHNHKHIRKAP